MTGKGTALELVEELERAARYVVDACRDHGLNCGGSSCECSGLAARLRARAERVREMERGALETAAMTTGDTVRLRVIRELCGADLGGAPEREGKP